MNAGNWLDPTTAYGSWALAVVNPQHTVRNKHWELLVVVAQNSLSSLRHNDKGLSKEFFLLESVLATFVVVIAVIGGCINACLWSYHTDIVIQWGLCPLVCVLHTLTVMYQRAHVGLMVSADWWNCNCYIYNLILISTFTKPLSHFWLSIRNFTMAFQIKVEIKTT